MQIEKCKNCKHFIQHYRVTFRGIEKTDCGECYARQKSKKDCTRFELEGPQDFENEISVLNLGLDYHRQLKNLLKYFDRLTKQLIDLREDITTLLKNSLKKTKKEQ